MKVIKMRPSHQPVIRSVIKVFKPEAVVECGCGPNSTPIWSAGCKSVVGIEHNQEWIDAIADKCGKNVVFVSKQFGNLVFSTYPEKLILKQRKEIYYWYLLLPKKLKIDLLFVDSFAGTRVYSLMAMARHAGITMYHDTEYEKYWYRYFEKKLPEYYPKGCRHFSYRPRVHGVKSDADGYREIARQEPCTDLIFRPEHYGRLELFQETLHEEHEKYYWEGAKMEFVEV
jgi:hypothetical protein